MNTSSSVHLDPERRMMATQIMAMAATNLDSWGQPIVPTNLDPFLYAESTRRREQLPPLDLKQVTKRRTEAPSSILHSHAAPAHLRAPHRLKPLPGHW